MTEADVALTDYAVTLECAFLTWLLFRGKTAQGALRRLFASFFSSAAIGALAGGTVHGFFLDEESLTGAILWRVALLALGVSTFAVWSIGGRLLFSERKARIVQTLAGFECVAYTIVILAVDQQFWIAIANYAPSIVFLGAAFLVLSRRAPHRGNIAGLVGVALTITAAIVQLQHIAILPGFLSHNAFYHLIQMAALGSIFLAARQLIAAPEGAAR